jgi:hypothetical protein
MSKSVTLGAALLGFAAPITVAFASGVHIGDDSAGWFVAASWFFAFIFAVIAQIAYKMEE